MRILVMSDCHRFVRNAEKVLDAHDDIKTVIFLGDGAEKIEELKQFYKDKNFYIVSGNCDSSLHFPTIEQLTVEGNKIIYTHGHIFGVKYGTERLFEIAQQQGAKLVLYGHTHKAKVEYQDGIYVINPGALYGSREGSESYAIIDVLKGGIMPNIIKI